MERDNRGGHNRKKVNENFFKKWSPDMAYVLGFIYTDGAVEDCQKSSRTCYLSLANNDYDLLVKIKKLMNSDHEIYVNKERLIKIKGKTYWCKKSYCLRIGNKNIYYDLIKIGLCSRKSLVIEMPKVPEKYFQYFLRGYFDGDGCINIEKKNKNRINIIFTSGSKVFLEQIMYKLQHVFPSIKGNVSFGCGAFRMRYSWRNAILVAGVLYGDIESAAYLKYKYDKYLDYQETKNL